MSVWGQSGDNSERSQVGRISRTHRAIDRRSRYSSVPYLLTRKRPERRTRGACKTARWRCAIGNLSPSGEANPDGMTIDHVCHTRDKSCKAASRCPHRRCVNPAHMEVVTSEENTRRGRGNGFKEKRACLRGHLYTKANTYIAPKSGGRSCLRCRTDAHKRYGKSR